MSCIQVPKIQHTWDFSVKEFKKVGSLEDSNMCHSIHHKSGAGLTREEDLQSTKLHDLVEEHNKAHVTVCTMSEGDNLQTAVMVARNAGMIHTRGKVILISAKELEGSTPASIAWQLAEGCKANTAPPHILVNAAVFARMSSGQKSCLVEGFQKLNRLGWKEEEIAVCSSLLLERAGTKCRVLLYRHFSPEDQTLSPTSPWGNGTSSSAQSTVLSYEDTTLWPLSSINCIIVASTFSKGKTFRKPIYTDCIFSVLLALQLAICLLLFFADTDAVYGGIQDAVLQNKHLWRLIKGCFLYQSSSQYQKWQRMLQRDPSWPPVNSKDFAAKSMDEIYINLAYEHCDEGWIQMFEIPAQTHPFEAGWAHTGCAQEHG
ncbi:hypothetical protein Q9966_008797 [Columba livia]|nr:hypothetical protein Q9966_008797 [Columba livia]